MGFLYSKPSRILQFLFFCVTFFNENNVKFVISVENWVCRHVIGVFLMKKIFLKKTCGVPQLKNSKNVFLDLNILIYISVDAFFNGDHENHNYIFFGRMYFENTIKKSVIFGYHSFCFGPNKGTARIFFGSFFMHILCSFFRSIKSIRNYFRPEYLLVLFF